jgi:hypothetical protein
MTTGRGGGNGIGGGGGGRKIKTWVLELLKDRKVICIDKYYKLRIVVKAIGA